MNRNLNLARANKNDEFYTMYEDIEKELTHYKDYFKDKVVYCNCDDYRYSNFVKYFVYNFKSLGLKKLVSTHYSEDKAYKLEVFYNKDKIDKKITQLKGNGDFRSEECISLLKEADIVVTNPPFSLFREYIKQLIEYGKKFLIIGNMNAITCKDIFPLIRDNKVWFGVSISSGDREFRVPDYYPLEASGVRIDDKGNKYIRVKGVRWFANIDNKKIHNPLELTKSYYGNEEFYPRYSDYDAINVDKTKDIPKDYYGLIGVPISFMDKWSIEQFEVVDLKSPYINERHCYKRLIIKRKS